MSSDPAALRVTLDTSTIDHRCRIEEACAGRDVELAHTTVTDRETEGTSKAPASTGSVRETWNLDESGLGEAALGADESQAMRDAILAIIGAGSFPPHGQREALTEGERHQLRDAMVLEAHVREGRDVLVTNDARGFVNHGRRAKLEALCGTRIMLVDEFCDGVAALAPPAARVPRQS